MDPDKILMDPRENIGELKILNNFGLLFLNFSKLGPPLFLFDLRVYLFRYL